MQARMLVFGLVLGSAGFAAGRVARSAPEVPACAVAPSIAPVHVGPSVQAAEPSDPADMPDEPGAAITDDDSDGVDVAELLASAETRSREQRREHNAIAGQVLDTAYNSAIAGCTVVVTSPALQGAQTAITDERGMFSIVGLPAATYLVTYYYNDVTVERTGVSVSELGTTDGSQRLDLQPRVVVTDDYVVNIPTARTFEGVVAPEGESFSGNDTYENTFIIDGDEETLTLPQ